MSHMEEFVQQIAIYLIKACNLNEIHHIDEMLDEHREESRHREHLFLRSDICDTVSAADTDHHAVEGWLIRFFLAITNIRDDVVGDEWCGMLSILNHLWHRILLAFRDVEDIIADDVYVRMLHRLQLVIRHDAF